MRVGRYTTRQDGTQNRDKVNKATLQFEDVNEFVVLKLPKMVPNFEENPSKGLMIYVLIIQTFFVQEKLDFLINASL